MKEPPYVMRSGLTAVVVATTSILGRPRRRHRRRQIDRQHAVIFAGAGGASCAGSAGTDINLSCTAKMTAAGPTAS
jgi:hypothetical protein